MENSREILPKENESLPGWTLINPKAATPAEVVMHDSGSRQRFEGGAVRDSAEGKLPYSLLPPRIWHKLPYGAHICDFILTGNVSHMCLAMDDMVRDMGLNRLVRWLELGSMKYERFNWAKGMYVSRCLDSLGRHLRDLADKKDDEDHGAAAMCNASFIMHYLAEIMEGRLDPKWNDLFDFDRMKNQIGVTDKVDRVIEAVLTGGNP